jgi:hypothetical protein
MWISWNYNQSINKSINHGLMKNVSIFLDPRKQPKMQWVQDPSQSNVDNINNVRFEASRDIRKKRRNI